MRAAKIFLLGDHSDGHLPFFGARKAQSHNDAIVADVQTWIVDNYHPGNPVAAMAARSGLTPRTFLRRFKAATGYTRTGYVQTLRIEEAKQLLETGTLPVEATGFEVGYEDPDLESCGLDRPDDRLMKDICLRREHFRSVTTRIARR